MDIQGDMLRKLKGRRDGYSLDQAFYIDPDYYRQDLESIWYKDWLFIGHDCEIPKRRQLFHGPGRRLSRRHRSRPDRARSAPCTIPAAIAARASARSSKGSSAKLVCPYHQWTYELDGKLALRPPDGRGFRQERLQPEARSTARPSAGYIFICLAEKPTGFPADSATWSAPYLAAAPSERSQGRLREHHHREGQLEARLGKQPRVLPLRRQPSGTLPHLSGSAERRPACTVAPRTIPDHRRVTGQSCEAAGLPSEFQMSPDRPVPYGPHAADRGCRELHHVRQDVPSSASFRRM